MVSAANGHLKISRLLVHQEAGMQDDDGETALMASVRRGHLEVARLLIPYEAGLETDSHETAISLAARSHQSGCLSLLLADEAEREASRIPEVMVLAYHGSILPLLARRNEWETTWSGLTALDFAVLGTRRRVIRCLTCTKALRQFFARGAIPKIVRHENALARFLFCFGQLIWDILPVICTDTTGCGARMFAQSLVKHHGLSRRLKPFYALDNGLVMQQLDDYDDKAQVAATLAGLAHIGFSLGGDAISSFYPRLSEVIAEYTATNPLKWKQVELAKREAKRRVHGTKQAAWREIDAESRFNRALLLEARDVAQGSSLAQRRVHTREVTSRWEKLLLGQVLLLDAFRFMERVVAGMLAE